MKVEKQKLESPKQFEPFNLILSVETEEEARALYAIFNFSRNSDLLGYVTAEKIRNKIGRSYHVGGGIIANKVGYESYYHSK